MPVILHSVPIVNDNTTPADALRLFKKYQILVMRKSQQFERWKGVQLLSQLYKEYSSILNETWGVENKMNGVDSNRLIGEEVFSADRPSGSWYVACIIQKNQHLQDKFLSSVPVAAPSFINSNEWSQIVHTTPMWLFCGRNDSEEDLPGRLEHTDSVSHSGTWHYQLSGSKKWKVRPLNSPEWGSSGAPILKKKFLKLRQACQSRVVHDPVEKLNRLEFTCHEGDIVLLNTRIWWHQTFLPSTANSFENLSISFARDFYLETDGDHSSKRQKLNTDDVTMTNIDGLYAPHFIPSQCVILTESQLPNCSLPRYDALFYL